MPLAGHECPLTFRSATGLTLSHVSRWLMSRFPSLIVEVISAVDPARPVTSGGLRGTPRRHLWDASDAIDHDLADLRLADQPEEFLRGHAKTLEGLQVPLEVQWPSPPPDG